MTDLDPETRCPHCGAISAPSSPPPRARRWRLPGWVWVALASALVTTLMIGALIALAAARHGEELCRPSFWRPHLYI